MAQGRKTGGRQKGSPNKDTADIRAMIIGALDKVGGLDYLAARAIDTPAAFMTLIGKVLPTQLTGENGAPIAYSFRWADAALPEANEQSPNIKWIEAQVIDTE